MKLGIYETILRMARKIKDVAQQLVSQITGHRIINERVLKIANIAIKVLLTVSIVGSFWAYTTNGLVGAGFVKQSLFVVTVNLALLVWLGVQIYARRFMLKWSSIHTSMLVWFIVVTIASILSQYAWGSLVGTTVTTINLISIWSLITLAFLISQRSTDELQYWLRVVLVSVVGLVAISVLQYVGIYLLPGAGTNNGAFTPFGTLRNFGVLLVLMMPIILSCISLLDKWKMWVGLMLGFLLIIFVQPLLATQLWWLFVLAVGGWLGAFYVLQITVNRPLKFLAVAVVLFSLLMAVWPVRSVLGVGLPVNVRMTHTLGYTIATDTVMSGAKEFLIGTGPSTFAQVYMEKRPLQLNAATLVRGDESVPLWSVRFIQPSSVVALLLVTVGVVGTIAFLGLLTWSLWLGWKGVRMTNNSLLTGVVVSVVVILISVFIQSFALPLFVLLFVLLGILAMYQSTEISLRSSMYPRLRMVGMGAVIVVLGVVSVGSIGVQGARTIASIYAAQSVSSREVGEFEQAVNEAGRAVRIVPYEDAFMRLLVESWLNYAISLSNTTPIDEAKLQNAIVAAIQASARAEQIDSTNGRNVAQLAFVFRQVAPFFNNAANLSAETYARAEKLEPTNPALPTERARSLLTAAQYPARNMIDGDKKTEDELSVFSRTKIQEAEAVLAESVRLKSDYAPARFLLANLAVQQNRVEQAIAELTELQKTTPRDAGLHYQRGLLLYSQQAYTESRDALQKSVELQPRFANAKYFLGLTLAQLGDINGAIAQFEEVKKIDEASSGSVDPILANLRAGRPPLANVNTTPDSTLEEPVEEVTE